MKTLIKLALLLALSSFLLAQVDSTLTDPAETVETEHLSEVSDSTETQASMETTVEEMVETDSTSNEMMTMDSTPSDSSEFVMEDTMVIPEPEMEWVANAPKPAVLAALMNMGPLYYWSNDGLMGLDFASLSYVTLKDPAIIAARANDCMDIVCHLLATDSSDVNYVVVVPEDSSNFKIYDTITKVVVIEAPQAEIVAAFDAYAHELAGMEYLAVAPADTSFIGPVLTDDTSSADALARAMSLKIRRNQFRAMEKLTQNPANLARDFEGNVVLNLFPDLKIGVRNSLLTPGWYTEWLTVGGVWDAEMKDDFISTLEGKELAVNVTPDFPTLIGVRIGNFAVNISGQSHIKMVIPGTIVTLPFQDISLNDPIDNSGLEIEAIPLVLKSNLSYAQVVPSPFGDVKVGVGLNLYEAAGYARTVSDDFTVLMTQDSVFISGSGEAWVTEAGWEGKLEDFEPGGLDFPSTLSDISFGIDVGAIMDIQPLIHQEVEVQVSLKNIGAQYKWSGLKHTAWTFEQAMPAPGSADTDSIEQYQTNEEIVISEDEELSIDVPTVFNLSAFYQPIPKVLIGAGIEKAFTDEVRLGYSPDLELYYQLNLYPAPWIDFSYYRQTKYGEPVHTFGGGFHFGMLETGLTFSFYNGINANAKGVGVGIRSSLHF